MALPNKAFLRASERLWKSRHSHRQQRLEFWRGRESHWYHHWRSLTENRGPDDPHVEAAWHDYDDASAKVDHWEELRDEASHWLGVRRSQLRRSRGRVRRPYERVVMDVRNQSSRGGVSPRLIVLHSTESDNIADSNADLRAIGRWFDNPSANASSHVGVDGEGRSARYVRDSRKAWTQAAYNAQGLSVEQIGHASQDHWPDAQLRKTAQYVAYWSQKYGIPIRFSTDEGVCEHRHLGASGGGHHDCGEAYPLGRVLDLARDYAKNSW